MLGLRAGSRWIGIAVFDDEAGVFERLEVAFTSFLEYRGCAFGGGGFGA